jgi:hypothetical protein
MTSPAQSPRRRPPSRPLTTAPAAPAILRLSSQPAADADEREALFYIDDVEYTIPVNPPARIGINALHITATEGARAGAMAEDYVMTEMLGADGWKALRNCKGLTMGDYKHLIQICTEKAMGTVEDDDPNS